MVDGYLKLMYPNGEFTKEELEEIIQIALEMRRRVKEQLKKLGYECKGKMCGCRFHICQ